jgi:hypothetical protein
MSNDGSEYLVAKQTPMVSKSDDKISPNLKLEVTLAVKL